MLLCGATVFYGLKALYCTTLCGAIRGFQPFFFVRKRVGVPLTSRGCSCLSCTNKADGIGLESLTSRGCSCLSCTNQADGIGLESLTFRGCSCLSCTNKADGIHLLGWCIACLVGALLALASGKAERRQVHPLKGCQICFECYLNNGLNGLNGFVGCVNNRIKRIRWVRKINNGLNGFTADNFLNNGLNGFDGCAE